MSQHQLTFKAFVNLGDFLRSFCEYINQESHDSLPENKWYSIFENEIEVAKHHNGWFTKENCLHAFQQWGAVLTESNLNDWLEAYDVSMNTEKTVALIMAGNIPLVGFHDLLSVLITGNKALIKLSSNDQRLIPLLVDYLKEIEPSLKDSVVFTKEKLSHYDAVIATGSNNTARYFEYYFGKKPNIIRKNRNSIAVLTGEETKEDLLGLGEDIFRYFGLGCRSVSKIFVPKGYDFDTFFKTIFTFQDLINHHKYANNYDYNKAVYLMSEFKILDNGFLILKEDESYSSPIASLFYEYYEDKDILESHLNTQKEKIQCIVSKNSIENGVLFGETQKPSLSDYADGVDTVEFLLRTS
ncbi:MAG: acyl-CoA reductase [Maribacter sp.]